MEKATMFAFYSLKTAGSLDLMMRVSEEANQMKPSVVGEEPPLILKSILDFQKKLLVFSNAFAVPLKQEGTNDKNEADKERDKCWRSSYLYIKGMAGYPNQEMAAIAQKILEIYKKYGNPTRLVRSEESAKLISLIEDIELVPSSDLTKINFDKWLEDLKEKQMIYVDAEDYYISKRSEKEKGIVQQSRKDAEKACLDLLNTVNVLASLEGEEKYISFIKKVNVIFDQQRSILALRNTLNIKKKEEERPIV